MPKSKSKKMYQNISAIYIPGHDEIWDDTELISQYDDALREWKEEKLGTGTADVSREEEGNETEPENVPTIGPWVAVEAATYDPETAVQADYVPSLNDFDLLNFYDDALREWKDEREPQRWKEIIQMLQAVEITSTESDSPSKEAAWVLVDENAEGLHYENAEELIDDLDAANVYSEALEQWKEERVQIPVQIESSSRNETDKIQDSVNNSTDNQLTGDTSQPSQSQQDNVSQENISEAQQVSQGGKEVTPSSHHESQTEKSSTANEAKEVTN